jgi:hypothetical protein
MYGGFSMKRVKVFTVFSMVLSILLLMGCGSDKKNNPTGPGNNTSAGSYSAKIAGDFTLNFKATTASGVASTDFVSMTGIQTSSSKTYSIAITLFHKGVVPVVGTHEFADVMTAIDEHKALAIVSVMDDTSSLKTYNSYSGTLTITASSPKLKGTFQFNSREDVEGSPEIAVTQGQFNVAVATP